MINAVQPKPYKPTPQAVILNTNGEGNTGGQLREAVMHFEEAIKCYELLITEREKRLDVVNEKQVAKRRYNIASTMFRLARIKED